LISQRFRQNLASNEKNTQYLSPACNGALNSLQVAVRRDASLVRKASQLQKTCSTQRLTPTCIPCISVGYRQWSMRTSKVFKMPGLHMTSMFLILPETNGRYVTSKQPCKTAPFADSRLMDPDPSTHPISLRTLKDQ